MAMSTTEVARLITSSLADASVEVQGGDGKYHVHAVSAAFVGMKQLERQRIVNRLLNAHFATGAIHAVTMSLKTPEESGSAAQTKG